MSEQLLQAVFKPPDKQNVPASVDFPSGLESLIDMAATSTRATTRIHLKAGQLLGRIAVAC